MQQQLSKKGESLSDIASPLGQSRTAKQQKSDEILSSADSSTSSSSFSSQRDSGLSSGITDGSSDDSLADNNDPTEQMISKSEIYPTHICVCVYVYL